MPPETGSNHPKYESYKEAWERISAARQTGFFLEAIAIEESIIADRLVSYLNRPGATHPVSKGKDGQWPGLGKLITALERELLPTGLAIGDFENIVQTLNAWKDDRNRAIHAIVKSDPGTPTVDIQEFLLMAEKAAEHGATLARAISSWHKREKVSLPSSDKEQV